MSDLGIYDAMEDELEAAILAAALPDLADIRKTLSMHDLAAKDGPRKPCLGIVDSGAIAISPPAIGTGLTRSKVTWDIPICVQNQRGAVDGRRTLRALKEGVRGAVHNMASSTAPRARYRWVSDAP